MPQPVSGVPAVDSAGQGGLMDVVLAPDFRTSGAVYLSASQAGPGGKGVVLVRGTMNGNALTNVERLFQANPLPLRWLRNNKALLGASATAVGIVSGTGEALGYALRYASGSLASGCDEASIGSASGTSSTSSVKAVIPPNRVA